MTIPQLFEPLVQLLEDAADGANKYGVILNLKQNPEDAIRADLIALIGTPAGPDNIPPAVPGLRALWNEAKSNKCHKTALLRSVESNGRALAMASVNSLKPALGTRWNSDWNSAGFTAGKLTVPTHPQVLLLQLRAYYGKNPAREVKSVNGIDCTAAACQAAADAIVAADKASNQSNTDAGDAQAALQAGIDAGRARLIGLSAELGQLMDDNDTRWLAFGFDMPGHPSSPDVPQNLTVTPGTVGSHTLYVHCDDARRADGYRFTVTNAADGTVISQQLTQDAEATFDDLTSGTKVNVTVTARNQTGESQPCDPVTVVVP